MAVQRQNRITVRARGARASTGIMASASGVQSHTAEHFAKQRTHSIFAGPLSLNTRIQSGRVSMTAEPNSAPPVRHVGMQTGIHAVTKAPQYPGPSPMMLGRSQVGGAQSQFGIPTVRGALTPPSMPVTPIMQRKQLAAGQILLGRGGMTRG